MDLLVLAAGMGSRFGGLKQVEAVGPNGEFILDYSINDAKLAGFEKVVFVIKEENLEIFESTIGNRLKNKVKVEYAFQELNDIPINLPVGREKPWGTVQAILCAQDKIDGDFTIINADDFYGRESFFDAITLQKELSNDVYGAVLFKAENTLSENGKVKRGVCSVSEKYINSITECEVCEDNGQLLCTPLDNTLISYKESLDAAVAMNMFVFKSTVFKELEDYFNDFFKSSNNLLKDECLITTFINDKIKNNKFKMVYKKTDSKWYGITYKEDLPLLKDGINEYIKSGEYNENLWG